jgi:hypothetical protein
MRAEVKEMKDESTGRKGKPFDLGRVAIHGRIPALFSAVFECLDARARSVATP